MDDFAFNMMISALEAQKVVRVRQYTKKGKKGTPVTVHEFMREKPNRPMTPKEVGGAIKARRAAYQTKSAQLYHMLQDQLQQSYAKAKLNMKGVNEHYQRRVGVAMNELAKLFPKVTRMITYIGTGEDVPEEAKALQGENRDTWAWIRRSEAGGSAKLILNTKYFSQPGMMESSYNISNAKASKGEPWNPLGLEAVGSTIHHEFGHVLDDYLLSGKAGHAMSEEHYKVKQAILKHWNVKTLGALGNSPKYGDPLEETFAEAFAVWMNPRARKLHAKEPSIQAMDAWMKKVLKGGKP